MLQEEVELKSAAMVARAGRRSTIIALAAALSVGAWHARADGLSQEELLRRIDADDPEVREGALSAIGDMGPRGEFAVKRLLGVLEADATEEGSNGRPVLDALLRIGEPTLIESSRWLRDESLARRSVAALVLAESGAVRPSLLPEIAHKARTESDPEARILMLSALCSAGSVALPHVGALEAALASLGPEYRIPLIKCIVSLGTSTDVITRWLSELAQDPSAVGAKEAALSALSVVASDDVHVLALMRDYAARRERGAIPRCAAIRGMRRAQDFSVDAAGVIAEVLAGDDQLVVAEALGWLADTRNPPHSCLLAVARGIGGAGEVVREHAAVVIARHFPVSSTLAVQWAESDDWRVRVLGLRALAIGVAVNGPKASRTILPRSDDQGEASVWRALWMARSGALSDAAIEAVRASLRGGELWRRRAACKALWSADGSLGALVPDLVVVATDPKDPVRRTATVALGHVGTRGGQAESALRHVLLVGDPEGRKLALTALARLCPGDDVVGRALLEGAERGELDVDAWGLFGRFGGLAGAAELKLRRVADRRGDWAAALGASLSLVKLGFDDHRTATYLIRLLSERGRAMSEGARVEAVRALLGMKSLDSLLTFRLRGVARSEVASEVRSLLASLK